MRSALRSCCALALILASGCGIPLRSTKVDDLRVPAQGVRYTIWAPSYSVKLKYVGKLADTNLTFKVLLVTTLKGTPTTYEAKIPCEFDNIFADTNASLTLGDTAGALKALTAGQTDRSLEFVQAVAGLVVAAGAAGAPAPNVQPITDYVDGLKRAMATRARLLRELDAMLVNPAPPPIDAERLTHMRSLIAALDAELRDDPGLALEPDQYFVSVKGDAGQEVAKFGNKMAPVVSVDLTLAGAAR